MDYEKILIDSLKELAKAIKTEIQDRMRKYKLQNSDLYKTMDVRVVNDTTLSIELADYFINVIRGRKPKVREWIPDRKHDNKGSKLFEAVLKWVHEKNIRIGGGDENRAAWIVYRSIMEKGVKPRPFLNDSEDIDEMMPFLDDYLSIWADELFDKIMYDINRFFNQ